MRPGGTIFHFHVSTAGHSLPEVGGMLLREDARRKIVAAHGDDVAARATLDPAWRERPGYGWRR